MSKRHVWVEGRCRRAGTAAPSHSKFNRSPRTPTTSDLSARRASFGEAPTASSQNAEHVKVRYADRQELPQGLYLDAEKGQRFDVQRPLGPEVSMLSSI